MKCCECRYFKAINPDDGYDPIRQHGSCQRYPPKVVVIPGESAVIKSRIPGDSGLRQIDARINQVSPVMVGSDFCGEYVQA